MVGETVGRSGCSPKESTMKAFKPSDELFVYFLIKRPIHFEQTLCAVIEFRNVTVFLAQHIKFVFSVYHQNLNCIISYVVYCDFLLQPVCMSAFISCHMPPHMCFYMLHHITKHFKINTVFTAANEDCKIIKNWKWRNTFFWYSTVSGRSH